MSARRTSNRDRLLQAAGEMLYRQGYNATSVDDIVQAAGVSKSNFYYHFPSKEDLGIAVLSVRRDDLEDLLSRTLRNRDVLPARRLATFLSDLLDHQESDMERRGCPFGNLVAEMTEHSERIRCFLYGLFADLTGEMARVIREGQLTGEFRADLDASEIATLLVQAIQGMHLMLKCERDARSARTTGKVLIELLAATPAP